MVLLHIVIALLGLVVASLAAVAPSRTRLYATVVCATATVATGTYLVITLHSNMLHACLSGLGYVTLTFGLAAVGRYRLTRSTVEL